MRKRVLAFALAGCACIPTVWTCVETAEPVSAYRDVVQEKEEKPKATEKENETEVISDMEARLESIRSLLQGTLGTGENAQEFQEEEATEAENFIKLLYNTMIENEVHERYANMIIDDLEKSRRNDAPIDHLLANVYQKMVLKFGKPSGITPGQNMAKTVFFIGPTGVGKTTTIAKIA